MHYMTHNNKHLMGTLRDLNTNPLDNKVKIIVKRYFGKLPETSIYNCKNKWGDQTPLDIEEQHNAGKIHFNIWLNFK